MSQIRFKRFLGMIWKYIPTKRCRSAILIYHALGNTSPAVSQEKFEQQMVWLSKNVTVITPDQFIAGEQQDKLQVCITFDDGYLSVHNEAFPILEKLGLVATVYVNPGLIDANERFASDPQQGHYPDQHFMNWHDVKRLDDAGWTIGSHGVTHLDLTSLSDGDVSYQLVESRRQIEAQLGRPCEHFAYTWGRHTASVSQLVAEAGYCSAVGGIHGPLELNSDPFALPRIDIRAGYKLRDFVSVVRGDWDYLRYVQNWRKRL